MNCHPSNPFLIYTNTWFPPIRKSVSQHRSVVIGCYLPRYWTFYLQILLQAPFSFICILGVTKLSGVRAYVCGAHTWVGGWGSKGLFMNISWRNTTEKYGDLETKEEKEGGGRKWWIYSITRMTPPPVVYTTELCSPSVLTRGSPNPQLPW
jgi:hypothetical protein